MPFKRTSPAFEDDDEDDEGVAEEAGVGDLEGSDDEDGETASSEVTSPPVAEENA